MKKFHMLKNSILAGVLATFALAMPLTTVAQEKGEHPGVTPGEMAYKGAPIPEGELKRVISPGAPDMTEAEYEAATTLYFQRCAGCHRNFGPSTRHNTSRK